VNYVLILLNVISFFFFFMQGTLAFEKEIWNLGVTPIYILRGQRLWTLLTSIFMHADIIHIAGNMVYLWVFGDNVEDTLGHTRYLLFYLVGGIVASFAHIASTLLSAFTSPLPYFIYELGIPSVGASGAISAVLGAYLLLYPRARIKTLVVYIFITIVSVPAYYYLGIWFLYQLLMGLVSLTGLFSSIAFWAHIGGFVYGLGIVKAFNMKPRKKTVVVPEERSVRPLVSPWVRTPLVDVSVEADRVIILAALLGVGERDIKIDIFEREVVISAEHEDLRFFKRVVLPVSVLPRVENFSYRNGVLSFTLYRIV